MADFVPATLLSIAPSRPGSAASSLAIRSVSAVASGDASPPSPTSASAPTLALSSSSDACIAWSEDALAAAASASALSSLVCNLCSASPTCWLMAAASGTEPPSLAASASALNANSICATRPVNSDSSGGVSGARSSSALTRSSSLATAPMSGAGADGGADSSLAMRASSLARSGEALPDCAPGRRCQAKASAITPMRPPSRPAARWVTKLFISEMVAAGGGETLRAPSSGAASTGSGSVSSGSRSRVVASASAAFSSASSSGSCCAGASSWPAKIEPSGSSPGAATDTSVAVPSMVGAGRLLAPPLNSSSPKGSAMTP